jgi:hypothetical protein
MEFFVADLLKGKSFGKQTEKVVDVQKIRLPTRVARCRTFKPKITIFGQFWRALQWKMLVYFTPICHTYFVVIWYISWLFGTFSPFRYVVPRKIWHTCFRLPNETLSASVARNVYEKRPKCSKNPTQHRTLYRKSFFSLNK